MHDEVNGKIRRRVIRTVLPVTLTLMLGVLLGVDDGVAATRPCKISGDAGSSEGTVSVEVAAFPGDCGPSTRTWGLLLGPARGVSFSKEGWYETNYYLTEKIKCRFGLWDIGWVTTGSEADFKCYARRSRSWTKIGEVGSDTDYYTISFKAKENQSGSNGKISFTTSPTLTSPTWIGSSYSGSDEDYGDKVTIYEASVP